MSEKKVPADGKWYRATWPTGDKEPPSWTVVVAAPPEYDGYCMWCEEKQAQVFAIDADEPAEAYPLCEDCCPEIAEEEGA